jgi:hypothetical protein
VVVGVVVVGVVSVVALVVVGTTVVVDCVVAPVAVEVELLEPEPQPAAIRPTTAAATARRLRRLLIDSPSRRGDAFAKAILAACTSAS